MSETSVKKFQSPVPIFLRIRDLIFGKRRPDIITQINFYVNFIIWITFLLWSVISFYTISARDFFQTQKHIPVESIIENRGRELGFNGGEFLSRLSVLNAIGIFCWTCVFVGLVLMYRKRKIFYYFFISPIVLYIMVMLIYISPTYFMQDTTSYDKVALLIMLISGFAYYYLMKDRKEDEEINFFSVYDD
jgi:hypothetical protein